VTSSQAGAFVSRQCASARVTECNLRLSRSRIIAPAPHGDQLIRELFYQEGGPGEGGGGVAGMRRCRTMQLAAVDQYCILRRGRPAGRGKRVEPRASTGRWDETRTVRSYHCCLLITALHVMQTRYSEENSVRLSVCLSVCNTRDP